MPGSFVSPEPIRQLRDLTRARTRLTGEQSREVQRLEKFLEDAGIKLSSVASDIMGVSGRAMLEALITGVDDPAGPPEPAALADLAKRRLRNKIPALVEALTGRFTEHHAFLVRLHLDQIDRLAAALDALAKRIEAQIAPFRPLVELLTTIPGVERYVAEVIIAETGGDMTVFPTAENLASWAGVVPGHQESAGKDKSGNSYLKGALGAAAFGAARTNGCWLQARYRWLTARRDPLRACSPCTRS